MVSKELKDVLERVETWPETRQADAARVLLQMEEQDTTLYRLSDEQVEEVRRRRTNPDRRFLTLEEVYRRFDRRQP